MKVGDLVELSAKGKVLKCCGKFVRACSELLVVKTGQITLVSRPKFGTMSTGAAEIKMSPTLEAT